jgi:hypothetical protein
MMPRHARASTQNCPFCLWKQCRSRANFTFRFIAMKSLFSAAALFLFLCLRASAQVGSTDTQHEREEAAVNPYTEPEVDEIFRQLDDVKPLPYEQLKRDFPQTFSAPREQLGLIFGSLIADGFLIVSAERKDRVDDLGRVLLRQAKALGVGDRVIRHSKSLTDFGKAGDWAAMRRELNETQTDVEQYMTEMKDERLAHLVGLGGWLRGLEISAGAVELNYSADRARGLWQRDLIHYYSEEPKTLPPGLAATPFFQKLRGLVDQIRDILDKAPPDTMSLDEVKALREKAHAANSLIAQTG